MVISVLLSIATIFILFNRGLNFGLDFTGGTLVEVAYQETVETSEVRKTLTDAGMPDAVVQHFGTTRDVLVRLPVAEGKESAKLSNQVVEVLRNAKGESFRRSGADQVQLCIKKSDTSESKCQVQVRRIEFVGPQIGDELAYKGGLALLYTFIAILIYVWIRFEWQFSVGAVVATAHDILLTFGFFSLTQVEFDLSVLAAILAVLGYSLNDTIVVFDRIRENFHTLRKKEVTELLNVSVNQTLSRTIMTSGTTLLTIISLFVFGGEIIHGFSIALIVGIIVGTYSSIFVATPVVLALGISREDLMPTKKDDRPVDDLP